MQVAVGVVIAILLVVGVTVGIGGVVWRRDGARLVDALNCSTSARRRPQPSVDSLPEPVARYFRNVLVLEFGGVSRGRLTQVGEFRLDSSEDSWRPFRATQHVTFDPPGFVWEARIRMAPFMAVQVRDAYVDGRASMRGKLLSVVPLMDEHDKKELSEGALQRYLAEAVWFPTALLPSKNLRWQSIDDHTAQATLSDARIEVSATFQFNEDAEIIGVSAERYREVDGNYVLTPWQGRFRNYTSERDARIPKQGEVAWLLPDGELVYWRGRIAERELE